MTWDVVNLPDTMDVFAPDGSEIRLLVRTLRASMVHCLLPPGSVSQAVAHRQVEEVWYCLKGQGELWRRHKDREETAVLRPGVSLAIPTGAAFQFRNTGDADLELLLVTVPPWPGAEEAMPRQGCWDR